MRNRIALLLLLTVCLPALAQAADRLGFAASWEGEYFETLFSKHRLAWEAADGGVGKLVMVIDTDSLDSNNTDRDLGMRDPEWFDTGRFPEARFVSESLDLGSGNSIEIAGVLVLKGHERQVRFPAAVEAADGGIRLSGRFTLDRRDFDIGSGEWREDPTIGYEVRVFFDVALQGVSR